jgi:CO/xanthine dehydrogenase FAD-binding subunit
VSVSTLAYVRPSDVDEAIALVADDAGAAFLAGGTTEIDLLLKDGVLPTTERLVDVTGLPLRGIEHGDATIRVGALTTMEELAADPVVRERIPFVREALLLGASTQLRNMATIGGNVLQRTRCRYFRDPTVSACNKRDPGSGCAAISGAARMHAILGTSPHCIALHASDVCVTLVALDAVVHTRGPTGERRIPLTELYRVPGNTPHIEHVLEHGELITAIEVPLLRPSARSGYLKVRDRVSYEFALTSAGVAIHLHDGTIHEARVALGGVGTVPWRAREAEDVLRGSVPDPEMFRDAANAALEGATTVPGTAFKVELAKRTMVRALAVVSGSTAA